MTRFDRDYFKMFDFSKSTLLERQVDSNWHTFNCVGDYTISFYNDSLLHRFSYGAFGSDHFLIELNSNHTSGEIWFETSTGNYRDGKLYYSISGFTEGESSGLSIAFEEWAKKSIEFIYQRGQGNLNLAYPKIILE